MRSTSILCAALILGLAAPAAAQVAYPNPIYSAPAYPGGDPLANQQRYRMELQRQQSAEQEAFARQHRSAARLTALEMQNQRRPEPYVPLVPTAPASPEAQRQALERATAQRRSTAEGVGQIDEWLARAPR